MKTRRLLLALLVLAVPLAAWTPLQVSIWSPLHLPSFSKETDVYGLRVNGIYGRNNSVYGIDVGFWNSAKEQLAGIGVGFVNFSDNRMTGIHAGVWNTAEKKMSGIQIGLLFNDAAKILSSWRTSTHSYTSLEMGEMEGIQISVIWNQAQTMKGLQISGDNFANASMYGVQLGLFNIAKQGDMHGFQAAGLNLAGREMRGFQIGGVNVAKQEMRGVNIGAINYAGRTRGVQIGLINITQYLRGVQIGVLNIVTKGDCILPVMPLFNVGVRLGREPRRDSDRYGAGEE